jgi:hypothetical protein
MSQGFKVYRVTIEGAVPIVMHNGQTADPLNSYSKAIKAISGKRKKVDDDYEKMAALEWEAALYVDSSDERRPVIISGHVVESCIVAGAKRSKMGPAAKTALYVDGDAKFFVDGKTVGMDDIKSKPEYRLATPVKVGMARVVRTRPFFKKWSAEFALNVMDDVANEDDVRSWIRDAGLYVGLCDWRPRYGRFKVVGFHSE